MTTESQLFNVDPYYDDYSDDKKFIRTLFKPGYAVQARELTQIQTGIQKQISKFANNIFKDGSIVSESQIGLNQAQFVRVSSLTGYAGVSLTDFIGLTATVSGKNTIRIIDAVPGLSSGDTNPVFVFSQYLEGATSFSLSDILQANYRGTVISATITGGTGTYDSYSSAPSSLPAFGSASCVTIDSGVRYVKGYFVNHDSQTITPYNVTGTSPNQWRQFNNLNSTIHFKVTDTIVTSSEDETLNDPAFNSYNYAAPGADRYRIDLELEQIPYSATADYTLINIQNGEATFKVNYPEYNILADTLARRTYDESGNYTVEDFPINIIDDPSDESKLKVKIGKGKAYIFGYEFINFANKELSLSKPRTTQTLIDQTFPTIIGNEVAVTINPSLTSSVFSEINFNSSPLLYISSSTASCNVVGTARLGKLNAVEGANLANLYEITLNTGYTSGSMKALFYPGFTAGNQQVFNFTNLPPTISKTTYNSLLFPVSNDVTSYALYGLNAQQFIVQRSINKFVNVGTVISISEFGTEYGSGTWAEYPSESSLKILSPNGTNVTYSAFYSGDTQNLEISALGTAGLTATIFANILIDETNNPVYYRTKTDTTETINVTMRKNSYEEFAYLNGNVDVYKLLSITGSTGGSAFNMTDYFTLDSGQRDDIYDWSKIVVKPEYFGKGITSVSVTYKKYSRGSGLGPYTIKSYPSGLTAYKEIPVYRYQSRGGSVVSLGGCYDFRPDRITPTSFTGTDQPQNYGATGIAKINDINIKATWQYYLPRTDKIILTKDKEFSIITGVETDQAPAPDDSENAMTIASIFLPPYCKTKESASIFAAKNRRYTMKDIGKIEKRVERLEYYTTLSLQEKEAKSLEIKDANGLNKFKNGIFVDDFTSRNNSYYSSVDHLCAVDTVRQEIRPRFKTKYVDFGLTGSLSSGLTTTSDGLILRNYTPTTFISQKLASKAINVNPFDVTNFNGSLILDPSTDDWIDTNRNPDVIVNLAGENNGISDLDSVDLGTVWNNWQTNWSGRFVSTTDWNLVSSTPEHTSLAPDGVWRQALTLAKSTTFQNSQTRTGVKTSLSPETVTRNVGDRIVDVSIAPFMRSKAITIKAKGLRPNVRVYPFFDGVDVTSYTSVNGVLGSAITTDAEGKVGYSTPVVFNLPSSTFRTGEKLLRLIDESNNVVANCTTSADAIYRAQGLVKTEEGLVVSTRNVNIRRENVSEEQIFNNTVTQTVTRWIDPVAQTFLIDPVSYPSGLYLQKVAIYFKSKSSTLPINLQIRPTVNGYPSSSTIVPFSDVYLSPSDITVSDDASVPTYFTFATPVYLQPGEFAIALLSNSNEYEVWVSEVGQSDTISGEKIASQPYAGSLFKSQNSSTWTAEQSLDLKFDIYKCAFQTGSSTAVFDFTETDFDSEYSNISNGANVFCLNSTYITPANTSISHTLQFESGGSLGSEIPVINGQNIQFTEKKLITDSTNDRIACNFTITSDSTDVSPAIDTQRVSGLYIQNLIYNFSDSSYKDSYETLATVKGITNSSNLGICRYISKKINLQEGFNSNDVDVYFAARLPKNSDVRVYLKSQSPTDQSLFDNLPYEPLQIHPNYAIQYGSATGSSQYVSATEEDYVDLRFTRGPSAYYTSGQTGQSEFDSFQVKVVLYGEPTNSVTPSFKDLKVIAT